MRKRKTMDPKIATSWIALLGSVFTAIIALIAVLVQANFSSQPSDITLTSTPVSHNAPAEIASLQNDVASLRQELDALAQTIKENPNSSPDVIALQADIDSLGSRFTVIEQAILDNPARVLDLTLLNRDMDSLKEMYEADLESTRKEIERVYSFNQWFLGAVITLSLAVVSLAANNFLKKPENKQEKNENKT